MAKFRVVIRVTKTEDFEYLVNEETNIAARTTAMQTYKDESPSEHLAITTNESLTFVSTRAVKAP